MPFKTATPSNAINPTDAGTDKYSLLMYNEMTPPINANGILAIIRVDLENELNVVNKIMKIRTSANGINTNKLLVALCWLSNSPPKDNV